MLVNEVTYGDAQPIDGYGPGFFRVGGTVLHGPVVVTATAARGWSGPEDAAALTALVGEVDVILFGAGEALTDVPVALIEAVEAVGIGLEPMATPAACRSYNVLLAEGRRVALAAVPV